MVGKPPLPLYLGVGTTMLLSRALSGYEPTPNQAPRTISASPTSKISTSMTNQSGVRFGLSPVMSVSCQAITQVAMSHITLHHTADPHPALLHHVTYRAQPHGGEGQRAGQARTSASLIASRWHPRKVTHERSRADQSFSSPSWANAPRVTADAGRGRIPRKITRYLSARLSIARGARPTFLHIWGKRRRSSFPGAQTVSFLQYPRKGFRYRPRALRRAVLQILGQRSPLSAPDLAAIAFTAGRPIIRPGYRSPTESEVSSTRRALRRLRAAGKVKKCGRVRRGSRQRSRHVYALTKRD
jgi:hypothetical protein